MLRIFGPPGTGKTTTLLNICERALAEGVKTQNIAFLAFTRKAATEAKERAAKKFNLNPETDLPYFRTLHSLAFRLSTIKESQLMQKENFDDFVPARGRGTQCHQSVRG
jgi:superfamily I DNA/RNA helicase